MSPRPDLDGIFAARSDQHALALALRLGQRFLAFVPDPAREARVLLSRAVGKALHSLTLADLSPAAMDRYLALCERRQNREPISHLLGVRAFWEHEFVISAAVLDPRPETETLVQAALDIPFTRVLDLGTGSGCILGSLLVAREGARGVGVDLSDAALEVATLNIMALDVVERAELLQSDWFDAVEGRFDLIVSNPPYIAADEMSGLAPELSYEPRMALTDEGDGLSCYRIITAGAPAHLAPAGALMVEIGPTQGAAVAAMFVAAGFTEVRILPDLDGRDRVVMGKMTL